jgi:phage terminase large subunit GpA-like protein
MAREKKKPDRPSSDAAGEILAALGLACLPPRSVDAIAWIENVRWLSPESSHEIGPFRFDRAPYLIEPQKAVLDPSVPEVVLNWCSQAGKTELWLNSLLYWSEHAPSPALLVGPDWKSVKSLSADRIRPMMRDARLFNSHGDSHGGAELQSGGPGSDNSAFRMTLNGRMPLTIVHSSSASALAQRPVRFLIFDETSRMPVEARGRAKEGDPIALGKIRQTTFGDDAKTIYVSSPVEEHQCRISELYEDSTRERYHSRCPLCRNLQVLRLPEMNFDDVTCRCLSCGQSFGQDHWQSEKGEWVAENPGASRRGFWLNFAVSPFVRWETVFTEFREAVHRREEGDESLFRVVVATRLAENFVEKIERMSEPEILLSRREHYPFQVPDAAKVIVAAVDTQATWLEYLVAAAGARGELWCLETGTIVGRIETDAEAMYHELDQRLLSRQWQRPDGRSMAIVRCLQDSGGHATGIVYRYCKQYARVMMAYRGSPDIIGPWKRGTDATAHARLIQGNANYLKNSLATRLTIAVSGPGYIHFGADPAQGFDEEFFLQLLSERKEKRKRLGTITTRWVQLRERNEALDLVCMILCALEMYRGRLDSLEPQIVRTESEPTGTPHHSGSGPWGAQPLKLNLAAASDWQGFGAVNPREVPRSPYGAHPGTGISW